MNYNYLKRKIDTDDETLIKRLKNWVKKGKATKKVLSVTNEGFTIQYNFDTRDKLGNKKPCTLLVQRTGKSITGLSLFI